MKKLIGVLSGLTLGFSGCGGLDGSARCFGAILGQAVGDGIGTGFANSAPSWVRRPDPFRPDFAFVSDAGSTFISVVHEGGRVELRFEGSPRPGTLPRIDETCVLRDRTRFQLPDGGVTGIRLEVTSAEQTPVDGGLRLVLECAGLERRGDDGGMEALPDLRIDVVARQVN